MIAFASTAKNRRFLLAAGAAIAVMGGALAAYPGAQTAPAEAASSATPAIAVGAKAINPKNVRVWSEFSGRMTAVNAADIRPEVGGRLTEIRFRDGDVVQAGTTLFVIDPRPYEAAVAKANAALVSARASAALANNEFDRAAALVKTQTVSRALYDQRANARAVAIANVEVAEAALKQAQLDVDHAYVKAPITGRISRPEITLGNLVQTGPAAPLLASIVSNDGIYADFEVDEQTYMESQAGQGKTDERQLPVELTVRGNDNVTYKGTIYSFDNKIDTGSGTIRARARFANEDGALVPGMFVSVKLGSSVAQNALLVPDRAIGVDQSKKFVYVVENNTRAAYREVTLGREVDGERIVLAGVNPGERVIVDGLQQVQPGATVQVRETVADASMTSRAAVSGLR